MIRRVNRKMRNHKKGWAARRGKGVGIEVIANEKEAPAGNAKKETIDQIQIRINHAERRARKANHVQGTKVLVPNRKVELSPRPPYQPVKMTAMMVNLESPVGMRVRLAVNKVVAEKGEFPLDLIQVAREADPGQSHARNQDQRPDPGPDLSRIPADQDHGQGHPPNPGLDHNRDQNPDPSLNQGLGHRQGRNLDRDPSPGRGRSPDRGQSLGRSRGQSPDLNRGQGRIRILGQNPGLDLNRNQSQDPDRIQGRGQDRLQGLNLGPDQFHRPDRIRCI